MSFDITDYKLKHIVSIDSSLLDGEKLIMEIDDKLYIFKADRITSEFIEFVKYFKYGEIKNNFGPIEKELKNYTYGKSFNDLSEHELYKIRFSKFKVPIFGDAHELEITGAGPTALKVSLYMNFNKIETLDSILERNLKEEIIKIYTPKIENNEKYQEQLRELKEKYDEEINKREKIREEVRKEEEEKERKRRELEELLNSNKPKTNDKPFRY